MIFEPWNLNPKSFNRWRQRETERAKLRLFTREKQESSLRFSSSSFSNNSIFFTKFCPSLNASPSPSRTVGKGNAWNLLGRVKTATLWDQESTSIFASVVALLLQWIWYQTRVIFLHIWMSLWKRLSLISFKKVKQQETGEKWSLFSRQENTSIFVHNMKMSFTDITFKERNKEKKKTNNIG